MAAQSCAIRGIPYRLSSTLTPPDMGCQCSKIECGIQHVPHPFCAFRENLKSMPVRHFHHAGHCDDVFVRDIVLEEITHRVNKHHPWRGPREGLRQFFWHQSQIKSLLVWMARNATKPLSKSFGVAVLTAWADFCATPQWIPGSICPFDLRVAAHYNCLLRKPVITERNSLWTELSYYRQISINLQCTFVHVKKNANCNKEVNEVRSVAASLKKGRGRHKDP